MLVAIVIPPATLLPVRAGVPRRGQHTETLPSARLLHYLRG